MVVPQQKCTQYVCASSRCPDAHAAAFPTAEAAGRLLLLQNKLKKTELPYCDAQPRQKYIGCHFDVITTTAAAAAVVPTTGLSEPLSNFVYFEICDMLRER